ncbi:transposase [Pseudomonas sp. HK3]
MPNYVRSYQQGGTFFFTVVTYHRQPLLTLPLVRKALRESIIQVRAEMPFKIDAWCLTRYLDVA